MRHRHHNKFGDKFGKGRRYDLYSLARYITPRGAVFYDNMSDIEFRKIMVKLLNFVSMYKGELGAKILSMYYDLDIRERDIIVSLNITSNKFRRTRDVSIRYLREYIKPRFKRQGYVGDDFRKPFIKGSLCLEEEAIV